MERSPFSNFRVTRKNDSYYCSKNVIKRITFLIVDHVERISGKHITLIIVSMRTSGTLLIVYRVWFSKDT